MVPAVITLWSIVGYFLGALLTLKGFWRLCGDNPKLWSYRDCKVCRGDTIYRSTNSFRRTFDHYTCIDDNNRHKPTSNWLWYYGLTWPIVLTGLLAYGMWLFLLVSVRPVKKVGPTITSTSGKFSNFVTSFVSK